MRSVLRVWRGSRALIKSDRPDLAVLIDAETLSVMLARWLRARGIPVVFFFPPQVWLWGRWRLPMVVPLATRVLSAFREEAEIYRAAGANSLWVGHPLSDAVRVNEDTAAALRKIGLTPARPLVALMPGSRRSGNSRPVRTDSRRRQIASAARPLGSNSRFRWPARICARSWRRGSARTALHDTVIYKPESYAVLSRAEVVLQCSGTATLEAGLLGIPSVIVYRCRPLYYCGGTPADAGQIYRHGEHPAG